MKSLRLSSFLGPRSWCLASLLLALLVVNAPALEPVVYDLVMQAGEDYRFPIRLDSCADNPLPIPPATCQNWQKTDLTGYGYKVQFRSAPAPSGVVYANLSTVFTNMTSGGLELRLSKAQTAANSGRSGVWDLQQTAPDGTITYIVRGKAAVSPTVTR